MLCRQHASVWEEAPQTAFILAAQHPSGQFCSPARSQGGGWGHQTSELCVDST